MSEVYTPDAGEIAQLRSEVLFLRGLVERLVTPQPGIPAGDALPVPPEPPLADHVRATIGKMAEPGSAFERSLAREAQQLARVPDFSQEEIDRMLTEGERIEV